MNLTRMIVWGLTALLTSGTVALKVTEPDDDVFRGKHQSESFEAVGSIQLTWDFGEEDEFIGSPYCSAILIDADTALTAAHCYSPYFTSTVTFGDETVQFDWLLPDARQPTYGDLAILQLAEAVSIEPLVLYAGDMSDIKMGDRMIQLGYGLGERYQTDFFTAPYFATVGGTDWFMWFAIHSQLNPGDSGGAVIIWCTDTHQHVLLGVAIAAWVDRSNNRHYANFATRIDIHKEWIDDNRNGN